MAARSTEYYRKNPDARRRKYKTDKKINARPEQKRKRAESNRARRKAKRRGQNIKGKQYDHAVGRFVDAKTNMGRKGEGGRVKGSKRRKRRKS